MQQPGLGSAGPLGRTGATRAVPALHEVMKLSSVYPELGIGYTPATIKRLVDIDDDLLERARSVAGTDTIKDTVNAGLRRLVDDERVSRHIERLRGSGAARLGVPQYSVGRFSPCRAAEVAQSIQLIACADFASWPIGRIMAV